MWGRRKDCSRRKELSFQPSLDGTIRLESRIVLSRFHQPLGIPGGIRTAAGGEAVEVTTPQGQIFYVHVTTGSIRATYNHADGSFNFNVVSSAIDSVLTINPIIDFAPKRSAHDYNLRASQYTNMLDVGSITVQTGTIGAILGYRDAVLTGPIISLGTTRVDRIAFEAIEPGASIRTGGDVNILNALNDLTLSGAGTSISIGRDLNELTVGGNLNVTNDATFVVGRDVGLNPQFTEGTAPALQDLSLSAQVIGNLNVNTGGRFVVNQHIVYPFQVQGSVIGASNITVDAIPVQMPTSPYLQVGGTIS